MAFYFIFLDLAVLLLPPPSFSLFLSFSLSHTHSASYTIAGTYTHTHTPCLFLLTPTLDKKLILLRREIFFMSNSTVSSFNRMSRGIFNVFEQLRKTFSVFSDKDFSIFLFLRMKKLNFNVYCNPGKLKDTPFPSL